MANWSRLFILAFSLTTTATYAAEGIAVDAAGEVVDPNCRYRIQELLDARKNRVIVGGELTNAAINRHTDHCNAVRSKQWERASELWEKHNHNVRMDELNSHSKRLTESHERLVKSLQKANEESIRTSRALRNRPAYTPSAPQRGIFSDRGTFFPEHQ